MHIVIISGTKYELDNIQSVQQPTLHVQIASYAFHLP